MASRTNLLEKVRQVLRDTEYNHVDISAAVWAVANATHHLDEEVEML